VQIKCMQWPLITSSLLAVTNTQCDPLVLKSRRSEWDAECAIGQSRVLPRVSAVIEQSRYRDDAIKRLRVVFEVETGDGHRGPSRVLACEETDHRFRLLRETQPVSTCHSSARVIAAVKAVKTQILHNETSGWSSEQPAPLSKHIHAEQG